MLHSDKAREFYYREQQRIQERIKGQLAYSNHSISEYDAACDSRHAEFMSKTLR